MNKIDAQKVVKCACGLPMRQKDWADHWRGCSYASSVPISRDDVKDLEAFERRMAEQDAEHQEWLKKNGYIR